MKISSKKFGTTKAGEQVTLFILENKKGMQVALSNFGAAIVSLVVPAKDGSEKDVVLGFDKLEGYFDNDEGFGAFVGRNANRIANAKVTIQGKEYALEANDGPNNLHSGFTRTNYMIFDAESFEDDGMATVEFSRLMPSMEQGFPGNLDVTVTYSLTEDNELMIEYFAVSDEDTVVNLTNHSYFNLNGHDSGDILDHILYVDADQFTPTNEVLIPNGELRDVEGTPMDFRTPTKIGERIDAEYDQLKMAGGYDHNYVLNTAEDVVGKVAELYSEKTGIAMEVFSDMCGMQIYTGNFINHKTGGKGGATYEKRAGVCFETQYFPNACNEPNFASSILKAGEEYDFVTIFKFSVR